MAWYHMNEGPPSPAYPGEYPPLDPTLAWYHLNEDAGPTAGDSGGLISDDGTLADPNGDPEWTTGLYGSGLSFDGNDRVTVPHSAELNPTEGITIEAWVNPSINKANNYLAIKMTPSGSDYSYGMKLENTYTGYTEIGALLQDPNGNLYFAYGGSVPLGTWTHVVMTYEVNPTEPTHIRLYQNGVEVAYRYGDPGLATDTIPAGTLIRTNSAPLNIGVIPVGTPYYYQGIMDEVRILGRALTPEEIEADGLITSPTVLDSSGNENHGSPMGGVGWATGIFSYGLSFDGATAYVEAPHHISLNTDEQVTIEAWVNPSVNKPNNYVANKMLAPDGSDIAYALKIENTYTGYSEIGAALTDPNGNQYFAYGGSVPLGTWTHVAMTYEMNPTEATHIRLYQDGVEVSYRYGDPGEATDTIPAGTYIGSNTGPLSIGRVPVAAPQYFQGTMDELRILSQALTPSEILLDSGMAYKPSGNLTSVEISPDPGEVWDRFYASDDLPANTSIAYSIVGETGSLSSGDDISFLGYSPIQLHAELSTSDPSLTSVLDEWSLTCKEPELDHIVVSPADVDVPVGAQQQFTATGYDSVGSEVAITPVWTTSAGSISVAGLLTAQGSSGCGLSVQATEGAIVGTATVDVVDTELCDGQDNDCDGTADEDFPNLGQTCTVGVGECEASGVYVCTGDQTGTECDATPGDPVAELCDGLDNDCDGTADEDNPEGGGQCGTTDVGECEYGSYECQSPSLVCVGNIEPVEEICENGLDDDCDGDIDDQDICGSAEPQTPAQQLCINELNKGLAKVAKTQGKDIGACIKNGSKGKLGAQSIEECCTADNKGKVAKAQQKMLSKAGPKCTETPGIGPNDPNTVNRVAVERELALIHAIFGSDLDAVVADALTDQDGAKCQVGVAKAAQKCHDAKLKEFNKCKKTGLGGTVPFSRASDLESCMGLDPKQKIKKACETKLGSTISKKCPGSVDTAAAFPGCNTGDPGELGLCLDRLVGCQVCLALNEADRLSKDCDLFDDTLDNDSCP
jgi:hypothetical protein